MVASEIFEVIRRKQKNLGINLIQNQDVTLIKILTN